MPKKRVTQFKAFPRRHSAKNKYGVAARELRTCHDITFDSKAEMLRYNQLFLMSKAGLIHSLELQPKFELLPAFIRGGDKIRAVCYIADFRYTENGKTVVEDVKGVRTKEYSIKLKLFLHRYPDLIFREVHDGKIKEYGCDDNGRVSDNKSDTSRQGEQTDKAAQEVKVLL